MFERGNPLRHPGFDDDEGPAIQRSSNIETKPEKEPAKEEKPTPRDLVPSRTADHKDSRRLLGELGFTILTFGKGWYTVIKPDGWTMDVDSHDRRITFWRNQDRKVMLIVVDSPNVEVFSTT